MELSQLAYFRAVARTEHFTRAAEELHITQPSLSKAIANLEGELGVPLFDREGKRVRLNPYGAAFLERVEQILSLTDEAVFFIRDMKEGERGHVRIGSSFPITPPSPVYYYQYSFFQAHPQVALSLSARCTPTSWASSWAPDTRWPAPAQHRWSHWRVRRFCATPPPPIPTTPPGICAPRPGMSQRFCTRENPPS